MRFSQVDFVDDSEVSAALFGTVERWAREKGCDQVHGPLGFTDCDREGMLVDGFDRRSLFFTNYNAPYYPEHLTRLGYRKDVDWIEYRIAVPEPGKRRGRASAQARSSSSSASICTWPHCTIRASTARLSARSLNWSTRPIAGRRARMRRSSASNGLSSAGRATCDQVLVVAVMLDRRRSLFFTNYNAPYYPEHLTRLGYRRMLTGSSTALPCPNRAERTPIVC